MSDPSDDLPPAWNATERSRAQTRGLITALSRDRVEHFSTSPVGLGLVGLVSFGVLPLIFLSDRMSRWLRIESTQWSAFMRWAHDFQALDLTVKAADPEAEDDTYDVDEIGSDDEIDSALHLETAALGTRPTRAIILAAVLLAVAVAGMVFDPRPAAELFRDRASVPRVGVFLAGVVIAGTWTWWLIDARASFSVLDQTLRALDERLSCQSRRPLAPLRNRRSWNVAIVVAVASLLATLAALFWPVFVLAIPYYAVVWNRAVASSRRINLQLIERLLEWMDDTGLPVEYEVTALNPDEIAAMMR